MVVIIKELTANRFYKPKNSFSRSFPRLKRRKSSEITSHFIGSRFNHYGGENLIFPGFSEKIFLDCFAVVFAELKWNLVV
jgi:hypothetical protein